MSHMPFELSSNIVNIRDYGAVGDGTTDDTAAIQAACDVAAGRGGICYIPASYTPYMFSNILLNATTRVIGASMRGCTLQRIAGSTGAAIRERTAAEGNVGATGIWLQDFSIDGNNGAGDGIDLGSQVPAAQFASQAGIQNVYVARFPTGTGFKLNANAISLSYLWAGWCDIGLHTLGSGASVYHSVWAENCNTCHIKVSDIGNMFFGIQIEDTASGTNPVILVESYDNFFEGIYVALQVNKTVVVKNATGANRNTYRHVHLVPNGFTWTHLVYHEGTGVGTGAVDYKVDEFAIGEGAGVSSWYVNGSTGHYNKIAANLTTLDQLAVTGAVAIGAQLDAANNLNTFGALKYIYLDGDEINSHYETNADAGISVNYDGYQNAGSRFRSLAIYNGKRQLVANFDGVTRDTRFYRNVEVDGVLALASEVAAPQITSNQNDYNPTGLNTSPVLLVTSDAARDITGLVPGATGHMLWVYNNGAFNVTLKHQNAGSAVANRIVGRGAADVVLVPNTGAQLYYSPSVSRWIVMTDTL